MKNKPVASDIQHAADVLSRGGVVIFPTDTAFGIGCRMDSEVSVERLFDIRKRPTSQATPVLVSSETMARSYFTHPSKIATEYMSKYWPGALTIIESCDVTRVPSLVRGGGTTVGFRMPNHDTILTIIELIGVPILGPSANFHGLPTPYSFSAIDRNLAELVDFVLPGECAVGQASTVVDCSVTPPKILRQGSVTL